MFTAMKVVLQNCQHNLFVYGEDAWTEDADAARAFEHAREALAFVIARGLQNMRIVLRLSAAVWPRGQ